MGLAGADQEERPDDDQDGADVPPHRGVVQLCHDPDAGDVENELDRQERRHSHKLAAHQRTQEHRPVAVDNVEVAHDGGDDGRVDEAGGGEIDASHDGDLASQVEPGRPPAQSLFFIRLDQ